MMLEMLAQCNWKRPLYIATSVGGDNYISSLQNNFIQEGLVNRISPFVTNKKGAKKFDTEKVYNNVMNRFKFGGIDEQELYIDETVMRMCYGHRRLIADLALNLCVEGKEDKAKKVLDFMEKKIPEYNVPADFNSGSFTQARALIMTKQTDKAKALIDRLWKKSAQYLTWYLSLDQDRFMQSQGDCLMHIYIMQQLGMATEEFDKAAGESMAKKLETFANSYQMRGGRFRE